MKIIDTLEKTAAVLAKVQPDKLLHFIGGQIIWHAVWRLTHNVEAATLATVAIGIAKEVVIDRMANKRAVARGEAPTHTVDGYDAMATALGGVAQWLTHI